MAETALNQLLEKFIAANASDLYLTVGAPASMRVEHELRAISAEALTEEEVNLYLSGLVSEEVIDEFRSTLELNTAIQWHDQARFRLNAFKQRQQTGVVLRRIRTQVPTLAELSLPKQYADMVMEPRGLVLVVGQTGAGKSTSLAAMIEYRNQRSSGHIVTIEDPIEFIHEHKGCLVTQRDIGIDTYSVGIALKNALRQRPDVIVIGEIRDRDTMEHALVFSETGHLCLATLHAHNTHQAIDRIVNFFPEEKHKQVRLSLAMNIRGIFSQRMVLNVYEKRTLAIEVMLNQGLVRNLIREGRSSEILEQIERNRDQGMQSFDQCLFDMCIAGEVSESVALAEADNGANLRLQLTQHRMQQRVELSAPALKKETGF